MRVEEKSESVETAFAQLEPPKCQKTLLCTECRDMGRLEGFAKKVCNDTDTFLAGRLKQRDLISSILLLRKELERIDSFRRG